MFQNSKRWFYSFDICNPNYDFISINETSKQGCLILKPATIKKMFV